MKNVLAFLHAKHKDNVQANTLFSYKTALKWIINTSHHAILDSVLISRYLAGLFNLFPRPPKRNKDIWDVNTVLDYWDRQPFNSELTLMMLSQKVVLLILISTMHRRSELLAMNISSVLYQPNCMMFPLDTYPKTYSMFNQLEELYYITVRKYAANPNICPLLALQAYIRKTSVICSTKKLFITTQNPYRQIANMMLRRWILTSLNDAGIDITKYAPRTTCHALSSKAYFAGVNVDQVMLRAGWTNISSFVTHYNLPIINKNSDASAAARKTL